MEYSPGCPGFFIHMASAWAMMNPRLGSASTARVPTCSLFIPSPLMFNKYQICSNDISLHEAKQTSLDLVLGKLENIATERVIVNHAIQPGHFSDEETEAQANDLPKVTQLA